MKLVPVIAFTCLTLGGCAGMDATACRSSNWYDLGFRDGLFGMQPQDDQYDVQCRVHTAAVDHARYKEGWQHGLWELEKRRVHGGSD